MSATLTRREAALLGFLLRQVRLTAGDALTARNLPDLLSLWSVEIPDEENELRLIAGRVIDVVRGLPESVRADLITEECRLEAHADGLLILQADSAAGRAAV